MNGTAQAAPPTASLRLEAAPAPRTAAKGSRAEEPSWVSRSNSLGTYSKRTYLSWAEKKRKTSNSAVCKAAQTHRAPHAPESGVDHRDLFGFVLKIS